jgi:acyl-homoserine-lactone acylase
VRPASAEEFMAQYVLAMLTAANFMASAIVAAQPPAVATKIEVPVAQQSAALDGIKLEGMGSNGWAFASAATENGRGALLSNPHFPWYGATRFWEKHLTIPGELDVYGTGLIGTPGVSLGFNSNVGWMHTVSDSKRVVFYRLTLNPEDPTQYLYEDEWRSLESRNVSVNVLAETGVVEQSTKIWFSHHGPIVQMPGLDWKSDIAYAVRDANENNVHPLSQWLAMGQAQSMDDFIDAHRQYNAMPWVNTISTSSDGRAVYLDNSAVGALSDEAIAAWRGRVSAVPQLRQLYLTKGLVILDGSTRRDEWLQHPEATVSGTTPFEQRPLIESEGYVFNANDSYWLSDPNRPTTGFSPLYGATETPLSIRTRMNIHLLEGLDGFDFRGEDGRFSMKEIQSALFDNSGLTAHLLKPELLERCKKDPVVVLEDTEVNLTAACSVLANWDNRYNLDSRGAVLFREWITRYDYTATQFTGALFSGVFDIDKPAQTPVGLADGDTALVALARAVLMLQGQDMPLDIALGDVQIAHRAGVQFPVHGGNSFEGIANLQVTAPHIAAPIFSGVNDKVTDSNSLSSSGYNIAHGSSAIMTLSYTDTGPRAQALLSYSQSGAPSSEHFSDQTALYSDKVWRDIYFDRDDIDANRVSRLVLSE